METIQKISHLEHILKRPDSYVGPTAPTSEPSWILSENKFIQKNLTYSPALLKIFDEILVNAIDRNSMFPKLVKSISVIVDKEIGSICIGNNGPLGGIAVVKHETEGIWNPELTFGHLLTSTNYDDTQERVVGGRNGYGAKLANIYSSLFTVEICDAENKLHYKQSWTNNMSQVDEPIVKKHSYTNSSVKITFVPDWKRFGMTHLDQDFFKIIEKRVYDAVVCTSSNCKIFFQEKHLEQMNTEVYAKMYLGEDAMVTSLNTERWSVTVAPSSDGFQQVSFVNGVCTTKGGTHVDHVVSVLVSNIIEELASKKIVLKPQNVKGTLFVMVRSTLVNPTFGSQVKSECTLKAHEFGSKFESTPKFIKSVLKTGIQDEVLAIAKFKELKELKKTDGARKSKIIGIPKLDDANFAGGARSERCILIVTEGDSAKTLAVSGLSVVGRDLYGVFPLRGKCKNVRDASVKQLLANQEFNDLKKILGLQQGKEYTSVSELRYGKLMIMTDADNDGSHIKGLILNMIHYFWPSLLKLDFVVSMVTPIIKAVKGSESQSFYTDSAFRAWYENGKTGWKIKYYKGLGTSTSVEAREYFKNIKQLTVSFQTDESSKDAIVLAFDKSKADDRKQWLLDNSSSTREVNYGSISGLQISEFIHKDLINFSLADLRRSVASMCDGLKPSQRKVLYACFEKGLTKDEMKVSQLASYVSEKTSYHHGEVSLAETIVKLAHDFTGSNNIHLLEPCGQFGTRLMGGKDASQTRYIFTKLTPDARKLFDPKDDPVLKYLSDEGKSIEPEFFVPVLPTVLINGTEGIGTGFSCYVPPFNPVDIRDNIERILKGEPLVNMTPWFRGFKGTITQDPVDKFAWSTQGLYTVSGTAVTVTELPPGRWIQDYKEYLDELCEKKIISGYKNNSTTNDVYFEIFDYQGHDLIKDLKLSRTIRTSNMHLFHPTSGIKRYTNAEEILVDFVEIRVKYYTMRKQNMIKELTKKAKVLSNKAKFVRQVVDGDLIIFKRKKSSLEDELMRKFGAFDYLLDIKTYQYTEEAIAKLTKESTHATEELELLRDTAILDMWKVDIKNMVQQ
jgi:DNA topoisomerase II